jgi:hypothetical protein
MATTKERVTQATEYMVLEQRSLKDEQSGEDVTAWVESGMATSTTRTGAVSDVAGDKEGIWRPVPTRNWQSAIRTRTETTTKTKVEVVEPEPF